jgi:hypothetical protein
MQPRAAAYVAEAQDVALEEERDAHSGQDRAGQEHVEPGVCQDGASSETAAQRRCVSCSAVYLLLSIGGIGWLMKVSKPFCLDRPTGRLCCCSCLPQNGAQEDYPHTSSVVSILSSTTLTRPAGCWYP